jgi:hypothetical protein
VALEHVGLGHCASGRVDQQDVLHGAGLRAIR